MAVRLEWEGKPTQVERVALALQTVERCGPAAAGGGARNQLIWGDNKLVMGSLLGEHAGTIKLIYADPPFATGADFAHRVAVGERRPPVLEQHAYRDTWGSDRGAYLTMLYERIVLLHELLAEDGSLYLHLGTTVSHAARLILDEVFGPENFRNEIVWKRASTVKGNFGQGTRAWGPATESILFYAKSQSSTFNQPFTDYTQEYVDTAYRHVEPGTDRRYRLVSMIGPGGAAKRNPSYEVLGVTRHWRYSQTKMEELIAAGLVVQPKPGAVPHRKYYLDEGKGVPVQSLWDDIGNLQAADLERTGYPTQKPERLLQRIVEASSDPGDLVADLFCGSGTTAVVAERCGRRWIACDLGRFAIHTTRKRLLDLPGCRPFELRSLGAAERRRWRAAVGDGAPDADRDAILALYGAESLDGFAHLHGRKAGRLVHVGAVEAAMTVAEADDVLDELASAGAAGCDLLGWEWAPGVAEAIAERARRRGLDVRARRIPREVLERPVGAADAVRFAALARVELDVERRGREARVVLTGFAIPGEELAEGVERWSELVDDWSVDFDFDGAVFANRWRSTRTRADPALATQSAWHAHPRPGRHVIAVKVVDIFGDETLALAEVRAD